MTFSLRLTVLGLFCLVSTVNLAQQFDDISSSSGISFVPSPSSFMGGGTAIFDFNNDGLEDVYLTGCLNIDGLFKNMGDGQFSNVTASAGLLETTNSNTTGIVTGDIDNDGDRDLFVATWRYVNQPGYARNILYLNNGDETFTDVTVQAGLADSVFSLSASFIDLNLDGFLDLYVGNYVESTGFILEDGIIMGFDHDCFDDLFYLNNGDGTFTSMAEDVGINNAGCALAMAATDYDRDGDPDIMVANDFGEFILTNKLYTNNYPELSCTDLAPATGADIGLYGMGVAVGDYDEDLDLDYYITNLGANAFLHNEEGMFEDIAVELGVENESSEDLLHTSWGTFFKDLDNDSYLDLFVANGHIPTVEFIDNHIEDPNLLYHNNGDGTFTEIGATAGIANEQMGRGAACGDLNNDGQLDMVVVNLANGMTPETPMVKIYANQGNANNWISFSLEGVTCNRDAFGAQVELHVGGRILLRELSGGGGCHASQNSSRLHFGLGTMENVDSLVVYWPGNEAETFGPVPINEHHHYIQGTSSLVAEQSTAFNFTLYPSPSNGVINVTAIGNTAPTQWLIYDALGKQVDSGKWFSGMRQMEVQVNQSLADGLYTFVVHNANYSTSAKFVLQRH